MEQAAEGCSHVESACVAGSVDATEDNLPSIECSLVGVQPNRELVGIELPAVDHVPEWRIAASLICNLWKSEALHANAQQ